MSETQQVEKARYRYEGILRWLVANPHRTQGECAEELGYTQSWLSQIINSDMFQAKLREACEEAGVVCIHTTQARLMAIAAKTLDVIEERIDNRQMTERGVLDVSRDLLDRLGYTKKESSPANGTQQHLHLHASVTPEMLERARARVSGEGEDCEVETVMVSE